MSIIANTTVISNFACIGQIEALRRIHGKIHISAEVGWIFLTSMADKTEFRLFGEMPSKLGKGESSCLSIASHRNWLFLTDDLDARKQAKQMKIRVSGSLGCLILATERSILTLEQANSQLYQMIVNGYHSPVNDLKDLCCGR